ncbi:hypothetical protein EK21DRAFT_111104 [Setomelanomma holmii]|uniref:Uncharacterized protein n=1 Tax=Setomelanomma holmii TaxID=210430 RepID=A0A9P4HBN6_9PLEO|nr:hypothetical protein EK21DRAFT_111104 [Setomelanomma holmii]
MLIPRVLSIFLRLAQFLSAAITLGIASYLLQINTTPSRAATLDGPVNRLIYTTVIVAISVVLVLIWSIPSTASIVHWGVDLLFAAAWVAAFGVLKRRWLPFRRSKV